MRCLNPWPASVHVAFVNISNKTQPSWTRLCPLQLQMTTINSTLTNKPLLPYTQILVVSGIFMVHTLLVIVKHVYIRNSNLFIDLRKQNKSIKHVCTQFNVFWIWTFRRQQWRLLTEAPFSLFVTLFACLFVALLTERKMQELSLGLHMNYICIILEKATKERE